MPLFLNLIVAFVLLAVDPCSISKACKLFANPTTGGNDMKLSCAEFKNNELMPKKFTCDGNDINPALVIEDIPKDAKSLALIMDDPDAPMGTWVHWVVFDIPVTERIEENSIPGKQGVNNSGAKDYGGPCPPSGTHRYFFKIYALDKQLGLAEGINKSDLEKAMQGHILAKAELIGLYKRSR
jgi:Raf kinase inhibitor-like YbhB/YbcL family protein